MHPSHGQHSNNYRNAGPHPSQGGYYDEYMQQQHSSGRPYNQQFQQGYPSGMQLQGQGYDQYLDPSISQHRQQQSYGDWGQQRPGPPPAAYNPSAPSHTSYYQPTQRQPALNPNAPTFVPKFQRQAHEIISGQFAEMSMSDHGGFGLQQPYGGAMSSGNEQYIPFQLPYAQHSSSSMVDSQPPYLDPSAEQGQLGEGLDDYDHMYGAEYDDQMHQGQYIPSLELMHEIQSSTQAAVLNEIMVGLEQLLGDMDDFSTWSYAIKDRLLQVARPISGTRDGKSAEEMPTEQGKDVWKTAVRVILEMALTIPPQSMIMTGNPQYILAKLLGYLGAEIPKFIPLAILPVLGATHEKRTPPTKDDTQETQQTRCNLLIFFGELYDKVLTENGTRFGKLGEAVMEQVSDIIHRRANEGHHINNESIKHVIQVIKLVGSSIDETETGCKLMDEVLTTLGAYGVGHPQLSETIKSQLLNLIELRKDNWGRRARGVPSSTSHAVPSGTIIGTNGEALELNDEERDFLEAHFGKLEGNTDAETDTSIDDEYEQFLQDEQTHALRTENAGQGDAVEHVIEGENVANAEDTDPDTPKMERKETNPPQ